MTCTPGTCTSCASATTTERRATRWSTRSQPPGSARRFISSRCTTSRTSMTCWVPMNATACRSLTPSSPSSSLCHCTPVCQTPTSSRSAGRSRSWLADRVPPEGNAMEIEVLTGTASREVRGGPFTVFDSQAAPADEGLMERLGVGTDGTDLAAPPVVLPDFCHKAKSEMPSSIAVATKGAIRPTLTDAALNCGMALVALDVGRPSPAAVTDFYRQVAERFPSPPTWQRDLSYAEVLRAATEGADFAAERYDLSDTELDRVEERGRLDIEACGGALQAKKDLPWLVVQMSRLRFGSIGPSTHFLELQEVEEIFDHEVEDRLGIHAGQVTLQFHNGGGVLTGQLGALYAKRKSASRMLRAEMSVQKPLSHLLTARSRAQLARRMSAS